MDAVEALLSGPRARSAFVLRAVLSTPWAIEIRDRCPLALVAVVEGEAHVRADDGTRAVLRPGDVALFRGPSPYVLGDQPDRDPTILVHPGDRCETLDGIPLAEAMHLGVRTWGHGLDGDAVLIIGNYAEEGAVGRRLLDVLPPLVVQPGAQGEGALVELLHREVARDDPGQATVLDRLLDLLVVNALRWALACAGEDAPGWYAAEVDPVVGPALRVIHHRPEEGWTVAGLAAEVGVSRAAFARRFTDLVGESPIAYLTGWRMDLAADLLADPDLTLDAVARRVGYSGAFALSTAFKRARGASPSAHRRALAVAAA